ncbi:MAG: hypothetical protein JOY86_05445 [Candidatus Eremiobacteraeota bacterium]|nr:hypothetical protein [Candidatus Eremiobacteraeota bacterium]
MRYTIIALAAATVLGGVAAPRPANATGTAVVTQHSGSVKTYTNVTVRLAREELALTTSDGVGTLVIAKAACEKVGALVKCLPYDATLFQHGEKRQIVLTSGSVWLNPTTSMQSLPDSSAQVKPHGVLIAITSKAGTFVSFNGTVDRIQK